MKKILIIAAIMASPVLAETFNFQCTAPDVVSSNRFLAQGTIEYDSDLPFEDSNSIVEMAALLTDAGVQGLSTFVMSDDATDASSRFITNMTIKPYLYTEVNVGVEGAKYNAQLLLDFPKTQESRIRDLKTGKTYRANCEILPNN